MNREKVSLDQMYGTWALVDATAADEHGNEVESPWGPKPMGRLVFTKEGRMMAVLCDGRVSIPDGVKRAYSSYCGNFRLEGETLITLVDAASETSRIGGQQMREVALENGRLILMPPASADGRRREVFWERICSHE